MAFDLDLGSVRAAAKNTLATPWLMAKVANVAKVAKESAPNQPKPPETLATLAGLATLAISQQRLKTFQEATAEPAQPSPEAAPAPPKAVSQWCDVGQPLRTSEATDQVPPTPKKALAIDPGKRALLVLATTYCDRTGVSDKARAQWAQDVEDTPPELRGDLYQHLREQLPTAPPAPPAPHPAPAPKPMGWLHMEQPWRAADRLYQNHHWQCPACMAAARAAPGVMARCAEGQLLHDAYTSKGHHRD